MDQEYQPVIELQLAEPSGTKSAWRVLIPILGGLGLIFLLVIGSMALLVYLVIRAELRQEQHLAKMIVDVTDTNYQQEVLEADVPVVVDFYADWCRPCRSQSAILMEFIAKGENVKIAKIDAEANHELSGRYNIRAYPTLLIFKDGTIVARNEGCIGEADIRKMLKIDPPKPVAGESDAQRLVREARNTYFMGDWQAALTQTEGALELDKELKDGLCLHVEVAGRVVDEMLSRDDNEGALAVCSGAGESARRLCSRMSELDDDDKEILGSLFYDEACASALCGHPQRAVNCLHDALAVGFHDLDLCEYDSDLNSLRRRSDFKRFLKAFRESE